MAAEDAVYHFYVQALTIEFPVGVVACDGLVAFQKILLRLWLPSTVEAAGGSVTWKLGCSELHVGEAAACLGFENGSKRRTRLARLPDCDPRRGQARVNGDLNMSRALGDIEHKDAGITAREDFAKCKNLMQCNVSCCRRSSPSRTLRSTNAAPRTSQAVVFFQAPCC